MEKGEIECPLHAGRFDIKTGKATAPPCVDDIKTYPVRVEGGEIQVKLTPQEQARFAVVNRYPEDQVRDNIFKVVQDLDIPVKREQIKIVDTNTVVRISMDYTVPVDLLVYHLNLHFSPESENHSLI